MLYLDADEDNSEKENTDVKLDGCIISLEFAPLTKGIKVSNIAQGTSPDDIKFKFSNPKIGGGKVTDIVLNRNSGVANVYFEKCSGKNMTYSNCHMTILFNRCLFSHIFAVVSDLVKKKHTLNDVPLTVIPYYDDFEEIQESKTKTSDFSIDHRLDPQVMYYMMNTQEIDKKFDFETMKFDEGESRFYYTKQFDDPKDATEFKNKLSSFFILFDKDEVKIPESVFEKVKEAIESQRNEYEADKVEFKFDGLRVTLVGKKEDVFLKKRSIEAAIDRISAEAKLVSTDFTIDDLNKLQFLNFINYFKDIMTEFPGVQIHEVVGTSGKLSLWGTTEQTKDVQLKIFQDVSRISEIAVKRSLRQIDFLQRTQCKTVNDDLKKDGAMLLLINVEGVVGAKALQAKIMTLKRCDDNEVILKSQK